MSAGLQPAASQPARDGVYRTGCPHRPPGRVQWRDVMEILDDESA